MRNTFKEFLIENKVSFYNLYYTEFPSKKLKDMKAGTEKNKETKIEEIKYKELMTDFLQKVGSMNK